MPYGAKKTASGKFRYLYIAKAIPDNQETDFLDWLTYSDNNIDRRSKKKSYTFTENNLVA